MWGAQPSCVGHSLDGIGQLLTYMWGSQPSCVGDSLNSVFWDCFMVNFISCHHGCIPITKMKYQDVKNFTVVTCLIRLNSLLILQF